MLKRPVIGVTPSQQNENKEYKLNKAYFDAVIAAGGLPVMLASTVDKYLIRSYLKNIDGLLLSGGIDINPINYSKDNSEITGDFNSERDIFEIEILKEASENNLPILGICRGCQLINVASGGTLIQDIYEFDSNCCPHKPERIRSYLAHSIKLKDDSILASTSNEKEIMVNSIHHQAVDKIGVDLKATAVSDDGLIESIENDNKKFLVGVQWHPEEIIGISKPALELFREFIKICNN